MYDDGLCMFVLLLASMYAYDSYYLLSRVNASMIRARGSRKNIFTNMETSSLVPYAWTLTLSRIQHKDEIIIRTSY